MIDVVGRLPGTRARRAAGTIGLGGALGAHLVGGLAERQRLGLGEEVAQEQLVHVLVAVLERVGGLANAMKSAGISCVPWWISW
jgi:hypothetical protein